MTNEIPDQLPHLFLWLFLGKGINTWIESTWPVQRLAVECLALTVDVSFLERVAWSSACERRSTRFPTSQWQGLGATHFSVMTLRDI